MQIKQKPKSRLRWQLVMGYLAANAILFFVNPYASRWHYESHKPVPIDVSSSADSSMSLNQITKVMDSIDLAYAARKPTQLEQLLRTGEKLIQIVFLPSSFALIVKGFVGYIGPANSQQRAFTLSVKQRYNHLAKLAIRKGMKEDGFLFEEEPSLSKKNGQSFAALRANR